MAIDTRPSATPTPPGDPAATAGERILGMVCRNCRRSQPIGLSYVCAACFGPLEVQYDYAVVARTFTREAIAARKPGIWRYAELLPVEVPPTRGLPVGSTPLTTADRLGPTLGIDRLWLKDDTRNPSLSFKDRAVAVAAARAVEFGVEALACASTGNLAGATAAAAAAVGLPAYVFIPADLEPAKVDHALAYGATVVPVDGTYDDVNRLCLEIADETGWGFVNINLRPFYAEGSKTLAYEIAESLGWRAPDVVVAPVASGAMFTRLARGFEELVELGLIPAHPIRFVGGQAAGCAPVATAWAAGTDVIEPVREPDTIVRSLAIGNPADGRYAVAARERERRLHRSHRGRDDRRSHPRGRPARGHLPRDRRRRDPRCGCGCSTPGRHQARRRGRRPADRERVEDAGRPLARGGQWDPRRRPGRTRSTWPDAGHPAEPVGLRSMAGRRRRMSTVRIPPTLRTATGGEKRVEVEGATVRDCVSALVAAHPGLEAQLIGQDGDLNPFVNAFLNDTDIRHLEGLDTAVGATDTLALLPAMAGG